MHSEISNFIETHFLGKCNTIEINIGSNYNIKSIFNYFAIKMRKSVFRYRFKSLHISTDHITNDVYLYLNASSLNQN